MAQAPVSYPPLQGGKLVLGTIAVSLAVFMNVLDTSIANVAIPTIFDKFAPWVSVPVGAAIIGFVMYMKREYLWFPFSAVGVVIAAGLSFFGHYSTTSIWFPIIIVLVVKRVIYRWFGVKFFRERVVPVVLFAMMGLMTGMFIYKMIFAAMGKGFLTLY
jgi:hypothetical protein